MSQRFVTLRALMDGVPGADVDVTVSTHGEPIRTKECTSCPHDFWDHRLHPLDEDNPMAGGMTSCPLCGCTGTWGVTTVPGHTCVGHECGEHCDQLPDGGE